MKNKVQPPFIALVFLVTLLIAGIFLYIELYGETEPSVPISSEEPFTGLETESDNEIKPSESAFPEKSSPETEKFAWLRKEPLRTTFECNKEPYLFRTVREERSYYNEIYTQETLVGRLKAPPITLDSFLILAVPQEDCDRIYLTVARLESGAQVKRIFEWIIAEDKLNELVVGEYYSDIMTARNYRIGVSPTETTIIVASRDEDKTYYEDRIIIDGGIERQLCNPRTLSILDLRNDTSKVLLTLSHDEVLNSSGFRGPDGHCASINIGWIDDDTIYYDVYDASIADNRPLLERRTLSSE